MGVRGGGSEGTAGALGPPPAPLSSPNNQIRTELSWRQQDRPCTYRNSGFNSELLHTSEDNNMGPGSQ